MKHVPELRLVHACALLCACSLLLFGGCATDSPARRDSVLGEGKSQRPWLDTVIGNNNVTPEQLEEMPFWKWCAAWFASGAVSSAYGHGKRDLLIPSNYGSRASGESRD